MLPDDPTDRRPRHGRGLDRPAVVVGSVAILVVAVLAAWVVGGGPGPAPASPSASPSAEPSTPTASAVVSPSATPFDAMETPTPEPTSEAPPPPEFPCGAPDPACMSSRVTMTADRPFTDVVPCGAAEPWCLLRIDSFVLPGAHDAPIVLMLPGGPLPPGHRDYLWPTARWVAARGAVVFTADYRSAPAYGGGYPTTFEDVACAVRFARDRGALLGGDPRRITLVAHSFGGYPATVVTMSSFDYAGDEAACLSKAGSGRPDALVGIGAVYTLDRIGPDFLQQFLGGDRTTAAAPWAAADPLVLVSESKKPLPPVRIATGSADLTAPAETAATFLDALRAAGADATLMTVDRATHDSLLADPQVIDLIETTVKTR